MPITREKLQTALRVAFPTGEVVITALANDDDHWQVAITDAVFAGKTRLAQHKLVQQAVAAYDIHALAIVTKIP